MRNRFRNRFGTRSTWILLLSAFMLSGCSVGPNYHRPSVQTPPAFHGPDPSQQTGPQAASFADLPWWQVFHDPQLQELIRTALKQNYDVQLALERVTASRAQLGIARSNQFPQVSLNPSFSGGRDDESLKSNIFSLAGDVVFQLDLFGRYRRATEAARAQLLGRSAHWPSYWPFSSCRRTAKRPGNGTSTWLGLRCSLPALCSSCMVRTTWVSASARSLWRSLLFCLRCSSRRRLAREIGA